MSLFENDQYEWRETYFVLFAEGRRPKADSLIEALGRRGQRLQFSDVRADRGGLIESLTVCSPDDYSAMDISYVSGDEVTDQAMELAHELTATGEASSKKDLLKKLSRCTARLDVYHFEQTVGPGAEDDDDAELMDPGALLTILERLARLCDGLVIDPQSGILL